MFGSNNSNSGGYVNLNAQSVLQPTDQLTNTMQTNKWRVQSLQDALSRYAPPNSRGIYYSQDDQYEYEIYTDWNGIKTYDTYKRILCKNEDLPKQVSEEAFNQLVETVKKLEEKLNDTRTNTATSTSEMSGPENGLVDKK